MRTYGKLWLEGNHWQMVCDPHVAVMAKRIFQRIPKTASGVYRFENTPAVARDLEWFVVRFPLEVVDRPQLEDLSRRHQDNIATLNDLIDPNYRPPMVNAALPGRDYQLRVPPIHELTKGLLLADDVGLGKTPSAIFTLDEKRLPAVVVCPAHLPRQWEREINRFIPGLHTHVIKTKKAYELPKFIGRGPDVLITSYHKLADWQELLKAYCRSIIFDEVQELRHSGSTKYTAAHAVASHLQYRLGLSATPIYNYGGEIFNVVDILSPGKLGAPEEFYREWCSGWGEKASLSDPVGFGSWLREQHIMLRRTRADVGRELPKLSEVTHEIECDHEVLKSIEGKAGELARILLGKTEAKNFERMQATEEFNMLLRQSTGIAKAPYVSAFVEMIVDNGEKVVLFGWHRAVYEIWMEQLQKFSPVMYTGSESPSQKQAAVDAFVNGDSKVMIVSLRSGAGLDGLQHAASVAVFGELDWSPGVHEQCVGRIYRDGQPNPVQAFYLITEDGSDPFIAEILGLKRNQAEGLTGKTELRQAASADGIKSMAKQYLSKRR